MAIFVHIMEWVNLTENVRFYPYTFTGKEWCKSQWLAQRGPERGISETGYSYFGARYYDSDLSGLFLSVDPMAYKYPSLSPYGYCAWNPLMLVDPDGKELYIPSASEGGHNTALNVILSLVKEKNRGLIIIREDGKISFSEEISSGKLNNDRGLDLLNDLVKSDKKFFYETSDAELSTITTEGYKNMSDIDRGVVNASNYGLDSQGGHIYKPKEGFDGHVILSESGVWKDRRGNSL